MKGAVGDHEALRIVGLEQERTQAVELVVGEPLRRSREAAIPQRALGRSGDGEEAIEPLAGLLDQRPLPLELGQRQAGPELVGRLFPGEGRGNDALALEAGDRLVEGGDFVAVQLVDALEAELGERAADPAVEKDRVVDTVDDG